MRERCGRLTLAALVRQELLRSQEEVMEFVSEDDISRRQEVDDGLFERAAQLLQINPELTTSSIQRLFYLSNTGPHSLTVLIS